MVEDYGTHLKTLHHRDHTVKLVKEKKKKQSRKEEESRGSRQREEMMQTKEKSALYHTEERSAIKGREIKRCKGFFCLWVLSDKGDQRVLFNTTSPTLH